MRALFIHTDEQTGLVVGTGHELAGAIVQTTGCPHCEQPAGNRCVTRTGRRSSRVHQARFFRFWELPVAEHPVLLKEEEG